MRGRVWVSGAQSYRPFGTAAEATVVPADRAADLPAHVGARLGAALGIPGITAHRAVFGDGPVAGRTVLVYGVLGGVGSLAAQLARWAGATVLGTVRSAADLDAVDRGVLAHAVALDAPDAAERVRAVAPDDVHRVVEVALSANAEFDAAVVADNAVIAAYASADPAVLPFWPLLFRNVTLRLLGSDDLPAHARHQAVADLGRAAADGALVVPIAPPYPLAGIADAHRAVEAGARAGRVLIDLRSAGPMAAAG